jgi:hypothetical protein
MQLKNKIFFLLLIAAFSCKKEDVPPANFYYDYFPERVGTWVESDVIYIQVDEISNYYDTTEYQLREIIESTFIDNQGRPSLRIERYWRTADSLPWVIKDIWYATRTTTQAEKIEEDVRYLKMVFKVDNEKRWNGNIYNTLEEMECEYDQIHEPLLIGNLNFDSTVTVTQRFNYNFIEEDEAYEIYAMDVGLVKKLDKYFYITYVSGNPKYNGYYYHQSVTGYGQ